MSAPAFSIAQPSSTTAPERVRADYFVTADAHPSVLSRLMDAFAKLGLVPDRVHARREEHGDRELSVELRLWDTEPRHADIIDRALRAVIGVRSVITVRE